MPKAARKSTKKAPASAKPAKKASKDAWKSALFASKPRSFRIGGDIQPARDLTRFTKWPRYVRLQRQRKIMNMRLKVPPALQQFNEALDKNQATELFRLLDNYRPETKAEKKERLRTMAAAKADGKEVKRTAPKPVIKFGLNHVTDLVESKDAKLVVIATDVNPIELVVWLPALCRMQKIPYVIVKNKARLGALVHQKTAAAIAITKVEREHEHKLKSICDMAMANFNDNTLARRKWGGGIMGLKTQRRLEKRQKLLEAEAAKKAMY